ncbi:hypothetical protein GCM10010519_51070 [Streptomyces lactacystinicus]
MLLRGVLGDRQQDREPVVDGGAVPDRLDRHDTAGAAAARNARDSRPRGLSGLRAIRSPWWV